MTIQGICFTQPINMLIDYGTLGSGTISWPSELHLG